MTIIVHSSSSSGSTSAVVPVNLVNDLQIFSRGKFTTEPRRTGKWRATLMDTKSESVQKEVLNFSQSNL